MSRSPAVPLRGVVTSLAAAAILSCSSGGSTSPGSPGVPSGISFSPNEPFSAAGLEGRPLTPSSKLYVVTNSSQDAVAFETVPGAAWVSVSPSSGTIDGGASLNVTVAVIDSAVAALSLGDHSTIIVFREPTRSVEVGVLQARIRIDPLSQGYSMNLTPAAGLMASGPAGGPFDPAERSYSWQNVGIAPLQFTRTVTEPWVLVTSPASGSIQSQESLDFAVRLDSAAVAAFPEGSYGAVVRLAAASTPTQPIDEIDVTVQVGPGGPSMSLVPPDGFVADGPLGGPFAPASRSFTWSNNGTGPQSYSRTVSVPWLDVTGSATGTVNTGAQLQFDVTLNPAANGLSIGRHFGTLTIRDGQGQVLEDIGFAVLVQQAGPGAQIVTYRSTFTTAPHHAHFSAMNSTFQSGDLEDARIEWFAESSSGAIVDTKVGGSEFGVVFEDPGDYVVTLRTQGLGDASWSEHSVPVSVGTPNYAAECWLDPQSGSNGSGASIVSPFNNWASAIGYIEQNWVAGPTSEHCIHVKRGSSGLSNGGWNSTANARQGRIVYKPYGTGAKPQIRHPSGTWVRTGDNNAFAAIDLDITGDSSSGTSVLISHITAGNGSDGHNTILVGCDFHDCGAGLYFNDLGTGNATHVANGEFDFVAVKGCTSENTYQVHTLAPRSRYVLFQDNYWNAVQSQFGQRFNHVQHADFRGNEHERSNGPAAIFRIHSNLSGAETRWVSITDSTFHDEIWIAPDAGASHEPYPMRHIWIERCYVDGTGRTWALSAFATERLVIRNCWARGLGSCIDHRTDGGTTTATNWVIEGNSMVGEQTSGAVGRGWATYVSALTDVTFRNNLFHMPNLTGSSPAYFFSVGGTQDASQVFAECDGNQFSAPGGVRRWGAGFVQGGDTLSSWRANTGLDGSSSDAATADFADPTGPVFDLRIGVSSTAIDAAVPAHGVFVDRFGRLRVEPGDVGAHDRDGQTR